MHSRTQAHVFHLQTPSFAEHKALNDYYNGIVDLVDGFVESYQGKYGILNGYCAFNLMNYTNKPTIIKNIDSSSNKNENKKENKNIKDNIVNPKNNIEPLL